jgi:aspartate beta-hydroxylase
VLLRNSENCERCPETIKLIKSIPGNYQHAFFSSMAPNTHITKHHGPTNKKLRCHLPLVVPDGEVCRIRCGDETMVFKEGEPFVFDDSHEHEAWNDHPDQSRIVLIFDVWHPDLTNQEMKFLTMLRNSSMRTQKRYADEMREQQENEDESDFYGIIEEMSTRGADESQIFTNHSEFNSN